MAKKKVLSEDQVKSIIEDFNNHMPFKEIMAKYNLYFNVLKRVFKDAGVDTSAKGRVREGRMGDVKHENVVADYQAGSLMSSIARKYDIEMYDVRSILKENNVRIKTREEVTSSEEFSKSISGYSGAVEKLSDDQKAGIIADYAEGAYIRELVRKYSTSPVYIRRFLVESGVEIRSMKEAREMFVKREQAAGRMD